MNFRFARVAVVLPLLLLLACSDETEQATPAESEATEYAEDSAPQYNYDNLRELIIYGRASLAEVRQALTDRNVVSLTNTIHALYAMRMHRGVIHLLQGMWHYDAEKYPELSWDLIIKAPARIALASTINRIQIVNTDEYKNYIHSRKNDKNEFHIAQIVIALGYNGAPDDIEYVQTMADGDNSYIVQSAITSLALMGGNQARNALAKLWKKYKDTPRGDLIEEMLLKAYEVKPELKKTGEVNVVPGEKSSIQGPIK